MNTCSAPRAVEQGEAPAEQSLIAQRSGTILMAKGRRRRYLRGQINHKLQLGTLAAKVVIGSSLTDVLTEEAWLSSVVATWSLNKWTSAADDGPILVGVCHSDYTDAEIEEWIENTGSWETKDKVQGREVGRRLIRRVGSFRANPADAGTANYVLNNGRPIRTKCGWMLSTGQTLKVWAYNQGGSPLATTDPAVRAEGHANVWPK